MIRVPVLAALAMLTCCKPPATDEYVDRDRPPVTVGRAAPSEPIDSPDTEGAIWVQSGEPGRIIYGQPGEAPLLALACVEGPDEPRIRFTRFARADARAQAFMALIGNSHIARLPIDATEVGQAWIWEGEVDASEPDLEVLTGPRSVTATIPGAGMLTLNRSPLPGMIIDGCRFDENDLTAGEPNLQLDPLAGDSPEPEAGPMTGDAKPVR